MARYLTLLAVIVPFLAFAYGIVHPESKLYFSIPLAPATTAAPVAAANATAPANTTATNTTATTTGAQLNFIPLGQFLGNMLTGLFGTTGSSLGTIIGNLLVGIFGAGFTAAG